MDCCANTILPEEPARSTHWTSSGFGCRLSDAFANVDAVGFAHNKVVDECADEFIIERADHRRLGVAGVARR